MSKKVRDYVTWSVMSLAIGSVVFALFWLVGMV